MKERPILFSAEMVRAILEGRKTQTRRVVKNADYYGCPTGDCPHGDVGMCHASMNSADVLADCPYGVSGDRLWVRESLFYGDEGWCYRADGSPVMVDPKHESQMVAWAHHKEADTCSSIHMPRFASRITLEVVSLRGQRVQDITEDDAKAEGVAALPRSFADAGSVYRGNPQSPERALATDAFRDLWDRINGKKYPWSPKLWVWAIEFKRFEGGAK